MKKIISLLIFCVITAGASSVTAAQIYPCLLNVRQTGGNCYSMSAKVIPDKGSEYTFVAASYGKDNELLTTDIKSITAPTEKNKETLITANFDLSANPYLNQTAKTKFFLWDMDKLYPYTESMTNEIEITEIAYGKPTGGKSSKNQYYGVDSSGTAINCEDSAEFLVDGNPETYVGFYASFGTTGNMYIDLGASYKIDRIELLAYNDTYSYRAGDFNLVASNTVVDGAQSIDTGSVKFYVPPAVGTSADNSEWQIFRMPADSGAFRYISMEKFHDNPYGLLVAEVRVYGYKEQILTEDKGKCSEVAHDKPTGGNSVANQFVGLDGSGTLVNSGSSADFMVDGNPDTYVGFYASFGTTGNMYIDLKRQYTIDHIDVLAYNSDYSYRGGDCSLVLSNSVSDGKASSDTNKISFYLPPATAKTAGEAEYQSFYMPENSGSYRYVSFEKFFENTYGLLIAEVKVYVKDEDMLYSFDEYMAPVWNGNTVYNESITFIPNPDTGVTEPAGLMYTPSKILSVRSYDLKTEYLEGTDYVVQDGKLVLTENSRMKAWGYDEFYMPVQGLYDIRWLKPEGRYVNYRCGGFHARHQFAVTYEHNDEWKGPVPAYSGESLPKTVFKLENGEQIKILFYGDSITHGAEVSSYGDINSDGESYEPYMQIYAKLATERIKRAYPNSNIIYSNSSVPGWSSTSGLSASDGIIGTQKPDLMIIAFGMNDLSMTPENHRNNIEGIITKALKVNPDMEFILVATMLPNIESSYSVNNLDCFGEEYQKIANARGNIAIAPVTDMHKYLIENKGYHSMCGNGINHPNDFLARVYAQTVSALLIK